MKFKFTIPDFKRPNTPKKSKYKKTEEITLTEAAMLNVFNSFSASDIFQIVILIIILFVATMMISSVSSALNMNSDVGNVLGLLPLILIAILGIGTLPIFLKVLGAL